MNRLGRILLMIPTIYLAGMPAYYACTSGMKTCRALKITIADSSDYHFVTKRDIRNTVFAGNGNPVGRLVRDIKLREIEETMNARYRELRTAEAYMSVDGTLHLVAGQRTPILRIMPDEGGDYFLDTEGVVVRRRNLYTPRLHIAGGNINISQAMLNGVSVLDTSIRHTILRDIYYLTGYINSNSFWSAQIDQIYVDSHDEIILVPRVGNHTIHLGTTDNFEGKLRNLKAFYNKVLPEVGWNKYSVINLSFRDQIVCKRR